MKQYELVLKNEKKSSYRRIHWIILIANVVSLLLLAIEDNLQTAGPVLIILLFWIGLIAVLTLMIYLFAKKYFSIILSGALFWTSICWLFTDYSFVFWVMLLFWIMNIIATRNLTVKLDNQKIIYPSFPKKKIMWSDLNNLMFKDGLLTIDLKNNQLIQQLVDDTQTNIDEKEFNEFCRQQLNK